MSPRRARLGVTPKAARQRRCPENCRDATPPATGFNIVTKTFAEYSSTTLRYCIMEARRCGDSGFQIRDLQVAHRFNAPNFTASSSNEIFYRFRQPVHSCRFNDLALHGFRSNSTRGPFPRAARETRHAACAPRHLPAGEFATNDLAIWPVRELSGKR